MRSKRFTQTAKLVALPLVLALILTMVGGRIETATAAHE